MRLLKRGLGLGFALACASVNASALSCMPADLARTMEHAKQSETLYYILVGTLTSDVPIDQPKPDYENQFQNRPPQLTRVKFTGHSLAQNKRWDVPLRNFAMDVETRCLGPWCSGVPLSDQPQIMFVEANPGGVPVLKVSPCPGNVFPADQEGVNENKLRTCFESECVSDLPDFR